MQRPCLFLDRDGIIIKDTGYPFREADLVLIPEVLPLIRWAKQKDWLVIVVSNQSGVARGIFTERDLENFTEHLKHRLRASEAEPDAWYYCPFYENGTIETYKKKSDLRKPRPGLILKAREDFPINVEESIMVGDKMSDVIELEGLKTFLIQGRYPLNSYPHVFASHAALLDFLKVEFP